MADSEINAAEVLLQESNRVDTKEIVAQQFKVYELLEQVYQKNYFSPEGDKELLPQLEQGIAEVKNTILELASQGNKDK
jgi:hypothetical protein